MAFVDASPKIDAPRLFRRLAGQPTAHPDALRAAKAAPKRDFAGWSFTRRLTTGGRINVLRARGAGELGPGCYVVKSLRPNDDAISRGQLAREASVSREAQHPNLATVLATAFDHPQSPIVLPYNVLPYYEGVTLGRLMDIWRRSPVATSRALSIVRQVGSACGALHAALWLHGQIAARHVIVSPQGQATLLDLAGARRLDSQECDAGWPSPVTPVVTPEAASRHERLTAAADVYAMGLLLFELLTCRPVFQANTAKELAHCHRQKRPPDVRSLRSELTLDVNELVRRMLAKEPLRRPSDGELVQWLMEVEIAELSRAA